MTTNTLAGASNVNTGESDRLWPYYEHVIKSQQFSTGDLGELFGMTDTIVKLYGSQKGVDWLKMQLPKKRAMIILAEPSTRTSISFEVSCKDLGMECIVRENAKNMSSLFKGEALKNMFKVLVQYRPNVIIIRQEKEGLMEIIAEICEKKGVHLINAGDGMAQHPTQALLDMYTIYKRFGRLNGLKVMIGGDLLRGRTVHSLAYLLAKYEGNQIFFVSPNELTLPGDMLDHLRRHGVSVEAHDTFRHKRGWADVIYWTRVQSERSTSPEERARLEQVSKNYILGLRDLDILADPKSILMHPLPIKDEILDEVEDDPRAVYYTDQIPNGMYIRTALLCKMFGVKLPTDL